MTNHVKASICTDVILKMGKRLESEQRENIRLREALSEIEDVGRLWDGNREYNGRSHGKCVQIAYQALEVEK